MSEEILEYPTKAEIEAAAKVWKESKSRGLIILEEDEFQAFCYAGRKWNPAHVPLTKTQQKVFNMRRANYPLYSIANRLSMSEPAVRSMVTEIKAKGWRI